MTGKQRTLKAKVDDKLDQALEDSFPASDPVSFLQPVPDGGRKLPVEAADGSGRPARARKAKATRS